MYYSVKRLKNFGGDFLMYFQFLWSFVLTLLRLGIMKVQKVQNESSSHNHNQTDLFLLPTLLFIYFISKVIHLLLFLYIMLHNSVYC